MELMQTTVKYLLNTKEGSNAGTEEQKTLKTCKNKWQNGRHKSYFTKN